MKNFKLAFRSFFRKGNGNVIKVLSLGTGLAIGIVLIAKVCFELSYDNCYSNTDRIYQIYTGYSRKGEDAKESQRVSGAINQGFKDFIPGVEESTKMTGLFDSKVFFTKDKKKIEADHALCDTNFFKIFDREILIGEPAEVLSKRFTAMVSRSFAEKIGGISNAVGQDIFNNERSDLPFTIGGVYEDFPENGTFANLDVILSIETYPKSSRENWLGNDRYNGYVRLAQGIDPASLKDAIRKMQLANQPIEEVEQEGNTLWYYLVPFATIHTDDPDVKSMNILLSLIAFALIFTAVMNYILIVISSLVRRTKEVGVRKCYGAGGSNIRGIMLAETTIHLFISLLIASSLILAFRGAITQLVGASLSALFNPTSISIVLAVCVIVYLVSGLIPSYLFMKIPVSTVFRNYKESKRRWKLALLSFQFIATAFMVTLLIIIGKQYNMMANDNPGYEYKNLIYLDFMGIKDSQVLSTMDKIRALPYVEAVEASATLPIYGSSGNNIYLPGIDGELFNVADQYGATPGFFNMMGFKLLEGNPPMSPREVAVSRSFVEKISQFAQWPDGAVGKEIIVTEHSNGQKDMFTICGVYEDYRVGSISNQDNRPNIRFTDELGDENKEYMHYLQYMVIKVRSFESNTIPEIATIVRESMPEKEIDIHPYREEMRNLYEPAKKFRDSVMIGGVVTLIIALIGLIGYFNDETNRRSAEIAIRKINGAVVSQILSLFTIDILKISIPALLLGNIASYFVAVKWLTQFSEKIALSWWIFTISALSLLIIIVIVVILDCLRIAYSNPVNSLKNE